jgi:hypothetical protein
MRIVTTRAGKFVAAGAFAGAAKKSFVLACGAVSVSGFM